MARVNITVPDELLERARGADLKVSQLAAAALREELDRLAKLAELDAYLRDLGPIPEEEQRQAREWAERVLEGASPDQAARRTA